MPEPPGAPPLRPSGRQQAMIPKQKIPVVPTAEEERARQREWDQKRAKARFIRRCLKFMHHCVTGIFAVGCATSAALTITLIANGSIGWLALFWFSTYIVGWWLLKQLTKVGRCIERVERQHDYRI